jgi:hypothetical protein
VDRLCTNPIYEKNLYLKLIPEKNVAFHHLNIYHLSPATLSHRAGECYEQLDEEFCCSTELYW